MASSQKSPKPTLPGEPTGKKAKKSTTDAPANMTPPTNPRAREALDWRIRGYSYEAIAKHMQVSKPTAYGWVAAALAEARASYAEKASEVLEMELRRCDAMISALQAMCIPPDEIPLKMEEILKLPKEEQAAAQEKAFLPNLKFMDQMEKLLDRKARLMGFYRTDDTKVKEMLPWNDNEELPQPASGGDVA